MGEGTISGLTLKAIAVPARPTSVERRKPGFERSTRYHSTGLTRARVNETCNVDCHGSLRCNPVLALPDHLGAPASQLTIAKAIPTKAPILLTTGFQSAPKPLPALEAGLSSPSPPAVDGLLKFSAFICEANTSLLFPRTSSQSTSTQGSSPPRITPTPPHPMRYFHDECLTPSNCTGATCWLSCTCDIKTPYATPKQKSSMIRSPKGTKVVQNLE